MVKKRKFKCPRCGVRMREEFRVCEGPESTKILVCPECNFQRVLCPKCGQEMFFSHYCGVRVCSRCRYHLGLARCYCGWNLDKESYAEMVYHEGLK